MTTAPNESLNGGHLGFILKLLIKVTNIFRNKFSIKNHVEMRYYNKIYV